MSEAAPPDIIVGVDTHKQTHAAVAITELGARLAELTISVDTAGYRALEAWACSLGKVRAFGVEGTGSYGAGLSRFLCEKGHVVHEIARPDRGLRHRQGKTDHLDAENAARTLLRWAGCRRSEVRDERGRDDPPLKDRPRHRGQGAYAGYADAEVHHRQRPGGTT